MIGHWRVYSGCRSCAGLTDASPGAGQQPAADSLAVATGPPSSMASSCSTSQPATARRSSCCTATPKHRACGGH